MLPSKQLNMLTRQIIGCAIEVHRQLGPGLLESIYEEALCVELESARLTYQRQKAVPIIYKNKQLATPLKFDLMVSDEILVEVKAVESLSPIHEAQLLSYLRLTQKNLGLLINFNVLVLKDGIRRKINQLPPRILNTTAHWCPR